MDLGWANGPALGMGGGFRVACRVAPCGAAADSDLAFLPAPSQARISAAIPSTTASVTHKCVRSANRILPRSFLEPREQPLDWMPAVPPTSIPRVVVLFRCVP